MASYIQFTKVTHVETIERLTNSRNGNPRYKMRFTSCPFEGVTKTDSGFAYGIHDGMSMKPATVKFHYTAKGKCIIDNVLEGVYNA